MTFATVRSVTSPSHPVVMWRMQRSGGLAAHLVIEPQENGALAAWFVNGRPQGLRSFDDVGGAIRFSDRMQHQNWAVGWRLVEDHRA